MPEELFASFVWQWPWPEKGEASRVGKKKSDGNSFSKRE